MALGVGGAAAGAMLGAAIGLLQWLVLRRQVSWAGRWVLACTAGGVVALGVGGLVSLALLDSELDANARSCLALWSMQ